MNSVELNASKRENVGTGPARAVRCNAEVPAIIYGSKKDNIAVSVDKKAMEMELKDPSYLTKLYILKIGSQQERAVIRDVQYHPVTDRVMHVDFYRVDKGSKIHVAVPVHFINEDKSPGMKRGGVLNVITHNIDLNCPAMNIPDHITVDLEGLSLGDTIHLKNVSLPEGATILYPERDITIATIVVPSSAKSAESEKDSAEAEGEDEASSSESEKE